MQVLRVELGISRPRRVCLQWGAHGTVRRTKGTRADHCKYRWYMGSTMRLALRAIAAHCSIGVYTHHSVVYTHAHMYVVFFKYPIYCIHRRVYSCLSPSATLTIPSGVQPAFINASRIILDNRFHWNYVLCGGCTPCVPYVSYLVGMDMDVYLTVCVCSPAFSSSSTASWNSLACFLSHGKVDRRMKDGSHIS